MRVRVFGLTITLLILLSLPLTIFPPGDASTPLNPAPAAADGPDRLAAQTAAEVNWPMAGANPQRTSWTAEEVRGKLKPIWYKPIEPYISQKVQIIAANNTLYISTARGLYALDATTGAEKWVYPTEFPLGHSPTITNGVAYVGGLDRKLHAVDAATGAGLWTFEAGGGFNTNPLVVGDKVYAGSRDGIFYAVYANGHPKQGQEAWRYETGGPILFSAAYKDGVVFFASNDSHAYALNADTGAEVWKSAKLPGAGFRSFWPVVYRNRVIFAGSSGHRTAVEPGPGQQIHQLELAELYPNHQTDPKGTLIGALGTEPGDWAAGTPTINANRILNYLTQKPYRQTVFVLDRATGVQQETAPVAWAGTHSGTRYPPIVAADDVLYQQNNYMSDPYIAGGQVSGWKIGTPYISVVSSDWGAVDEPHGYSAGGNLIYWNLCCDREAGSYDVTIPNTDFATRYNSGQRPPTSGSTGEREKKYFDSGANRLGDLIPGYNTGYHLSGGNAAFGTLNGIYGIHGNTNPPIPYNGMVYMHRGNSIIAFSPTAGTPTALPMAHTVAAQPAQITPLGATFLQTELETQIQKMLNAGHLRPAYQGHGIFNLRAQFQCGDDLVDYWHNTAETIYILSLALPHLPPTMQQELKTYIQNEFNSYPPYNYDHVGWRSGAAREIFDLPTDVQNDLTNNPPKQENYTFKNGGGWQNSGVWGRNPFGFYALWKYAEIFGNAQTIYNDSKTRLESPPADTVLLSMPLVHNAFIAGYLGYLELEKLAGQPETASVRSEYNRMLALRAANFTKDSAYGNMTSQSEGVYCRTLNIASNFMFMPPELAQYLRDNALSDVQAALTEYYDIAPYWFVTFSDEGFAENAINTLYDSHSLFMAKALILEEAPEELEKYLDVPGFDTGDLYYIQKLVTLLENQAYGFRVTPSPTAQTITAGGTATYTVQVQPTGGFTNSINLVAGTPSPSLTVTLNPSTIIPPDYAMLTVTHKHTGTGSVLAPGLWFSIPITVTGNGNVVTTSVGLLVGGSKVYLPLVLKNS